MTTEDQPSQARTAGQAAISQGLSAASNFVILLALARGGGSGAVGEFALAFVVYNAALGLQRAVVSDALLARAVEDDDDGSASDHRAATTSLALSLACAAIVLGVGLLTPFHQLAVLALFLPMLLLEDLHRYLLFRRGRAAGALVVDGTWVAVSCIGFAGLLVHATSTAAIVLWGCGGAAACVVGRGVSGARFARPGASFRWWREHLWRSSRWLTLESVVYHLDQQVQAFGFVAVAGAAAFGHWRLTLALLGLAIFFDAGLRIIGVTHQSRSGGDRTSAIRASMISATFTLAVTAALLLVAPLVVPLVYGSRVTVPRGIILVGGVFVAASSAATGPLSLLRGQRRERALPVARIVAAIGFTPLAIVVARHHFGAGLWIVTAGAVAYTAIVSWAAFGPADVEARCAHRASVGRRRAGDLTSRVPVTGGPGPIARTGAGGPARRLRRPTPSRRLP